MADMTFYNNSNQSILDSINNTRELNNGTINTQKNLTDIKSQIEKLWDEIITSPGGVGISSRYRNTDGTQEEYDAEIETILTDYVTTYYNKYTDATTVKQYQQLESDFISNFPLSVIDETLKSQISEITILLIKSKELESLLTSPNKTFVNTQQQNLFSKMINSYPAVYYAGYDVKIYIDGYWIDDIITLNYTYTNNKSPIYGYASKYFDAVATGTKLVQGSFAIAFRENQYLYHILNQVKKDKNVEGAQNILNYKFRQGQSEIKSSRTENGIESFSSLISNGKSLTTPYTMPDGTIVDYKSDLSDLSWFYNNGKEWQERKGWDDIFVTDDGYGQKVDPNSFDMIISYGNPTDPGYAGTFHSIDAIHIVSSSMVCEPTGDPIAEIYNFFARSIDVNVGKYVEGKEKTPTMESRKEATTPNSTESNMQNETQSFLTINDNGDVDMSTTNSEGEVVKTGMLENEEVQTVINKTLPTSGNKKLSNEEVEKVNRLDNLKKAQQAEIDSITNQYDSTIAARELDAQGIRVSEAQNRQNGDIVAADILKEELRVLNADIYVIKQYKDTLINNINSKYQKEIEELSN